MFRITGSIAESPDTAAHDWVHAVWGSKGPWDLAPSGPGGALAYVRGPAGEVKIQTFEVRPEADTVYHYDLHQLSRGPGAGVVTDRPRPSHSATFEDLIELVEARAEISRLRRLNMTLRGENRRLRRVMAIRDAQPAVGPLWGVIRSELRPPEGVEVVGLILPSALREVADRIARSRSILDLEDNWDGEGSPRYDEATWRRGVELIVRAATAFHKQSHGVPPTPVLAPVITKGSEGAIDIQWRTTSRIILIEVPARLDEPVTFYAHDRENEDRNIGGRIDPAANNTWLLAWLVA